MDPLGRGCTGSWYVANRCLTLVSSGRASTTITSCSGSAGEERKRKVPTSSHPASATRSEFSSGSSVLQSSTCTCFFYYLLCHTHPCSRRISCSNTKRIGTNVLGTSHTRMKWNSKPHTMIYCQGVQLVQMTLESLLFDSLDVSQHYLIITMELY